MTMLANIDPFSNETKRENKINMRETLFFSKLKTSRKKKCLIEEEKNTSKSVRSLTTVSSNDCLIELLKRRFHIDYKDPNNLNTFVNNQLKYYLKAYQSPKKFLVAEEKSRLYAEQKADQAMDYLINQGWINTAVFLINFFVLWTERKVFPFPDFLPVFSTLFLVNHALLTYLNRV
jgi:ribosomal protein S18